MIDEEDDDRLFKEYSRLGGTISGFTAIAAGVLLGIGVFACPRAETIAFPIYSSYTIPSNSVTRNGQNLCWTRMGEKTRNPPLSDIDITVDYISEVTHKLAHQPTPGLFFEATGEDFTTDDVVGTGPFWTRVCVKLSSRIRPDQPVQLRQIAYFGSITTLYSVPVTLPTIVFPASASSLFAKHDTAPTPADSAVAGPKPSAPDQRSDADTLDDVRKGLAYLGKAPPEADGAPIAERYPTRVDTTLSERDAERLEQSRRANSDRSRRATLRRLIPRALDDEDRDALGPYDPTKR